MFFLNFFHANYRYIEEHIIEKKTKTKNKLSLQHQWHIILESIDFSIARAYYNLTFIRLYSCHNDNCFPKPTRITSYFFGGILDLCKALSHFGMMLTFLFLPSNRVINEYHRFFFGCKMFCIRKILAVYHMKFLWISNLHLRMTYQKRKQDPICITLVRNNESFFEYYWGEGGSCWSERDQTQFDDCLNIINTSRFKELFLVTQYIHIMFSNCTLNV